MRRFGQIALAMTMAAAALGFVAPQAAHACFCDATPFDAVSAADAIFVADVVEVRDPTPADIATYEDSGDTSLAAATAQVATLDVSLASTDAGSSRVEVRYEGGIGCGATLRAGMIDVVIVAYRSGNQLHATGCGGPISPAEIEEILAFELPEPDGVGPIRMVVNQRIGPARLIALDDRGRILSYDPTDAAERIVACDDGQLLEMDATSVALIDPSTWDRSQRTTIDRDLSAVSDLVCIGTSPLLVGWTEREAATSLAAPSNAVLFDASAAPGARITAVGAGANAVAWPAGNMVLSIVDGALVADDTITGELVATLPLPPSIDPPTIVVDQSAAAAVVASFEAASGITYTVATIGPELIQTGSFSIGSASGTSLSWNDAGQVVVSATSGDTTIHQVRSTGGRLVAEATEQQANRPGVVAGGSVFSTGAGVFATSLATGERTIAPWSAFRAFDQQLLPIAGNRTAEVTAVPEMPTLVPQELAFTDDDTNTTPFPEKPMLIAGAISFGLLALFSLISHRRTYRS